MGVGKSSRSYFREGKRVGSVSGFGSNAKNCGHVHTPEGWVTIDFLLERQEVAQEMFEVLRGDDAFKGRHGGFITFCDFRSGIENGFAELG